MKVNIPYMDCLGKDQKSLIEIIQRRFLIEECADLTIRFTPAANQIHTQILYHSSAIFRSSDIHQKANAKTYTALQIWP